MENNVIEIMQQLQAPFSDTEIEFIIVATNEDKSMGLAIPYVTSRAIQKRLDEVLGFNCWQTRYTQIESGFLCEISVKINDEWIIKTDGAEQTAYEPIKGALSSAMKRCASSGLGIGRYLYDIEGHWVHIKKQGKSYVPMNKPTLPDSIEKQIDSLLEKFPNTEALKSILKDKYGIELSPAEKEKLLSETKKLSHLEKQEYILRRVIREKLSYSQISQLILEAVEKKIA